MPNNCVGAFLLFQNFFGANVSYAIVLLVKTTVLHPGICRSITTFLRSTLRKRYFPGYFLHFFVVEFPSFRCLHLMIFILRAFLTRCFSGRNARMKLVFDTNLTLLPQFSETDIQTSYFLTIDFLHDILSSTCFV